MMSLALSAFLLSTTAHAELAEECRGLEKPDDYDEQVQTDFLNNYVALATTLSPIHGPIPHAPGRGAIGVDLAVIPPLNCFQRTVLNFTKTEDTNQVPVIPRPRITFALPAFGEGKRYRPYAGVAYVPPIPLNGTRSVLMSGEVGLGMKTETPLQLGVRLHATMLRTIGNIAGAFDPDEEPEFNDLFLASSFGADLSAGWRFSGKFPVTPYLSLGWTDVSTFFWIGDDSIVPNNLHPYFGPAVSAGVDTLLSDRIRLAAEFYTAPGGYSTPDSSVDSVDQASRYGRIYTGRVRLGWELGTKKNP